MGMLKGVHMSLFVYCSGETSNGTTFANGRIRISWLSGLGEWFTRADGTESHSKGKCFMSKPVSKTATVDDIIREKYRLFATPADQIVTDSNLAEEFAAMVNAELPVDAQVGVTWLNRRMMNLRKLGKDRGGLIRLQRGYQGRNSKPQRKPKPR